MTDRTGASEPEACAWAAAASVTAIGYGIGLPLVIYRFYHDDLYNPNLEAILRRMAVGPLNWSDGSIPSSGFFW